MKSILTRYEYIYNRKNKLNTNGEALIQIRMYLNGINRYYSTGIYLKPSDWNDTDNVPKKLFVLRQIEAIKHELVIFEQDTFRKLGYFTLKEFDLFGEIIPEPVQEKEKTSFTAYMVAQHQDEKVNNQESWQTKKLTIDYFKEYIEDVSFEQVNHSLIKKFDYFLRQKKTIHNKDFHVNTLAKHHKHIKQYILNAIKDDLLKFTQNPYQKFEVKTVKGKSDFLNDEELERFENLTFDEPNTDDEKIRDMFLLGAYTGLRYSDIYHLSRSNFSDSPDGMVLDFIARKTGKEGRKFLDILFFGKPRKIVDKYMPDNDQITLFKGVHNPDVNLRLKVLARRAFITKRLCFKDSRDTCGTYLMKRFPIALVKDELQHSNIKITNKYTHNNEEETKKAFKRVWKSEQKII